MRGLPGSGKSTVARRLAAETGVIHSNDTYSIINGVYKYRAEKMPENRQKNYEAFCRSLKEGVETVICDNTNTRRWEFENYIEAANKAGYLVAIVTMPHPDLQIAFERNEHNVPFETLEQMLKNWEN